MHKEKTFGVFNTFILLIDILLIGFLFGVVVYIHNENILIPNPITMITEVGNTRIEKTTIKNIYKEEGLYYIDVELYKRTYTIEINKRDFITYKVGDTVEIIIKGSKIYLKE